MARSPRKSAAESDAQTPLDFDASVAEVEGIIQRIESGEGGLERAVSEYERGMELLRRCRAALSAAEQRVKDVTARMQAELQAGPRGGARPPERGS